MCMPKDAGFEGSTPFMNVAGKIRKHFASYDKSSTMLQPENGYLLYDDLNILSFYRGDDQDQSGVETVKDLEDSDRSRGPQTQHGLKGVGGDNHCSLVWLEEVVG